MSSGESETGEGTMREADGGPYEIANIKDTI